MFYFGRIISAFFNQLFRFLFWNKNGQKLFIAIIIIIIGIFFFNFSEVHAVEEVTDVNYDVYSYYENVTNHAISLLGRLYINGEFQGLFNTIKSNSQNYCYYFYYGNVDGSSYANAEPINKTYINILEYAQNQNFTKTATTDDYLGITGQTLYNFTNQSVRYRRFLVPSSTASSSDVITSFYMPTSLYMYKTSNWLEFEDYIRNGSTEQIIQLLEDIKAEQQATNDFLNEEIDETGISVQAPQVTDTASENMSNNLHNQINTLTTQLQSTVNNYYEGWDAYVWTIPLPQYIGGNISFDSGVTRRIIGSNGVVFNVIQAIWVILFGGYIVGFIKRMLDWVQTGKIFDEGGLADFIWWMDTNNEIIKASMM